MMTFSTQQIRLPFTRACLMIALAIVTVGCASAETQSGEQFLTNPLPSVAGSDWDVLSKGCVGKLEVDTSFHIAEGAPELLVAENDEGLVCVDSFEAIESELTNIDPQAGNDLWLAYVATLQEVRPYDGDLTIESELAGVSSASTAASANATSLPVPETNEPTKAPVPETNAPETSAPVPETNAPETNAPVPETNAPVPETNAPVPETNKPASQIHADAEDECPPDTNLPVQQ